MKIRHLRVCNFRGIRNLDWFVDGDFLCLVGPGDSCKSTVLDALELAFTPRWNPIFNDADFFECDATEPLKIDVTIGDLPRALMSDAKYGLRLRGFDAATPKINDEPQEGDEEVLTIRLRVEESLEPSWQVVTDRHSEGATISSHERERLGVLRLGSVVDRELSWSRGSTLSRLTTKEDDHAQMLADAGRSARQTVDPTRLPNLLAAAGDAYALAVTRLEHERSPCSRCGAVDQPG